MIFEVIGALEFRWSENAGSWPATINHRGISWNCI
jgi:hypothetical protein